MQLLSATTTGQNDPRKHAEEQLLSYYGHQELPLGLIGIASHDNVPLNIRQAALLYLKNLVVAGWSDSVDGFKGQILVTDENKALIRHRLLELATTDQLDRRLRTAAGLAVSKIAIADYPDQWPDLLDVLLQCIPSATDGQLHGALKVLGEIVDESLNEKTFFAVAPRLVKVVYDVAVNEQRKPVLRALACSVFRGCFNILEMVMEDHKTTVRAFADEILKDWIPFFVEMLKKRLPDTPTEQEQDAAVPSENAELWKGLVSLKFQVVKVSRGPRITIYTHLNAIGLDVHTGCLPCSISAAKSGLIPSRLGRVISTSTCLLAHVHTRRASE